MVEKSEWEQAQTKAEGYMEGYSVVHLFQHSTSYPIILLWNFKGISRSLRQLFHGLYTGT